MYKEVKGDLIELAKAGQFNVIVHGCNCFCRQKSGVAKQMVSAFGTDNPLAFPFEGPEYSGDINKLGRIQGKIAFLKDGLKIWIVNAYTQYKIKKFNEYDYHYTTTDNPFDYEAFTLCMRKLNKAFSGFHIGMPQIGSHLAGGNWELIKPIIEKELKYCDVTVVIYENK